MSEIRFPVEAGEIMQFARAVGDSNPIYHDEAYAATTEVGHVIAPPTFLVANVQYDPDYPGRPRLDAPWHGSGREPSGAPAPTAGLGMHAEEHIIYHRHPRPGDVLTVTVQPGKQWEKQGRAGKLAFRERVLEYRDQAGELVLTERRVNVLMTPTPAATETEKR